MKKTLFYAILAIGLSLTSFSASAQYKHAVGGRFGIANGISFKTFSKGGNTALDFILNFQSKHDYSYFRFTGLYEIHQDINNAEGLRWYYGFGGTIGSINNKLVDNNEVLLAVDGVIGLDYKFKDAPINLALDWKPAVEVSPNTEFDPEGLGLSIRFTF